MLVTGEAPAELQRGGGLRALAPGVERRTHDLGAAAVVQGGYAAQMIRLNRVRRVCARAAVITHYSGQAVWRVHVVGAQSVGGRAGLLVVAVLITYTVIGVVLDDSVLLVVGEPAFQVRAVGYGVLDCPFHIIILRHTFGKTIPSVLQNTILIQPTIINILHNQINRMAYNSPVP